MRLSTHSRDRRKFAPLPNRATVFSQSSNWITRNEAMLNYRILHWWLFEVVVFLLRYCWHSLSEGYSKAFPASIQDLVKSAYLE